MVRKRNTGGRSGGSVSADALKLKDSLVVLASCALFSFAAKDGGPLTAHRRGGGAGLSLSHVSGRPYPSKYRPCYVPTPALVCLHNLSKCVPHPSSDVPRRVPTPPMCVPNSLGRCDAHLKGVVNCSPHWCRCGRHLPKHAPTPPTSLFHISDQSHSR